MPRKTAKSRITGMARISGRACRTQNILLAAGSVDDQARVVTQYLSRIFPIPCWIWLGKPLRNFPVRKHAVEFDQDQAHRHVWRRRHHVELKHRQPVLVLPIKMYDFVVCHPTFKRSAVLALSPLEPTADVVSPVQTSTSPKACQHDEELPVAVCVPRNRFVRCQKRGQAPWHTCCSDLLCLRNLHLNPGSRSLARQRNPASREHSVSEPAACLCVAELNKPNGERLAEKGSTPLRCSDWQSPGNGHESDRPSAMACHGRDTLGCLVGGFRKSWPA